MTLEAFLKRQWKGFCASFTLRHPGGRKLSETIGCTEGSLPTTGAKVVSETSAVFAQR